MPGRLHATFILSGGMLRALPTSLRLRPASMGRGDANVPPQQSASPLPARQTLAWLRATTVLAAVVPVGLLAAVAWYLYGQTLDDAHRRMERVARVAQEHALKLFETNEVLLSRVVDLTGGESSSELRLREAALHEQLKKIAGGLSHVQSIWMVDETGRPLATNRSHPVPRDLDFSQRPAFVQHRAASGQVVVTPPRVGAVTGDVFFDLSRRRELADGTFGGVMLVGLSPTYFLDFYRELVAAEKGLTLTLVHSDGHVMARWPESPRPGTRLSAGSPMMAAMTAGQAAGTVVARSSIDGKERLGAYRQVPGYPLYVFAGGQKAAALAGWSKEVLLLSAFTFPTALGLVLVSLVALRRTRQQLETLERLREEGEQRKKVEDALRQAQKLEAMGHLTGGVAHDFNNLLMVVDMNTMLLRRALPGPTHAKQLDAIQRAVGTGARLTRQLLAFSHRQPLMPRVLDLAEALPPLLELLGPALGSGVSLTGEVAPGTAPIEIDAAELELALINLAVNAKDAMAGAGAVHVSARNLGPGEEPAIAGPGVVLSVRDTGCGIAPEALARVFEPFYTTKPVGKGTGLGLSQVYGLCTRMGGMARVESSPGAGTTVHLCFPAATGAAAPADKAGAPVPPAALGLRVLLVEDNPDVATATTALLEAMDCRVTWMPSAHDALAHLQAPADTLDVVLSDIVMPGGLDGLDLARSLRARWPAMPLVLMTGYAQKLGEAESQGVVVLPKPFGPELLARALGEAATLPRSAATPPERADPHGVGLV